ncbi:MULTISPECIES: isoleucine--tRNA ligase [Aerococcus]|uniref:Isoleucine--tRNA ligase n=1 Tax=Aerococcus tenax TaxID=3078812 RepID=A0A5N1BRF7_9LACT|nr:isoleucine--tRNA ligase [Aerococcus urinae]KAA9242778.1 isoleucine--tRNA ligase [Aerococcus urinae]MDK6370969.1 isoleucine--tRNA ligase [Aerococcus urinae]MDK6598020.1 isoleucine--tRNA ligase [Aerococcus urinae]MDK7301824.1 isoleucine--tRNA ligase [Aerococcus urinae]MDK7801224.1 isoleucine--tRNA ligase [Aerococcus urinae]
MKMKDTLNLGKTKFPMRGNLPKKEPERQKEWEENQVYERRLSQNKDNQPFVLHDGPPYANGNIHIGHALNKITKDIIIRSKSMQGYYSPYVPGWDTHGLPIEQAVTNSGVDRKSLSTAEFRQICQDYASQQIDSQRQDFKRLGGQGDWEDPYITYTKKFEAQEIRVFGEMAKKGLIYRGNKPVYWSPSSESTLAEAEIEYKDVETPSIYAAFKAKDTKGKLPEDTEFIIWTTTPWTLPASEAIAVHPQIEYSLVAVNGHHYVVASELLESLAEKFQWTDYQVEDRVLGQDLELMKANHPFYDRELLLILGDHVTTESGTGLVHTAPGHGEDDYYVGVKYGLDVLSPVDDQGCFTEEAEGLEGIFYEEGNDLVIDKMTKNGTLLKVEYFVHSYPHDWRTKKPVIFRALPQWFCSVDKIREKTLDVINNEVTWWHPSGQHRIYNMIRDRGDWVISRQRVWGVPLPIFYAEDGTPIISEETIDHVAKLFEEHGSNIWFEKEAKDLLPEGYQNEHSPNGEFTKENDIMDVWFDSGSSWAGVLQTRDELSYPADMYLEGSDQYRGWFNSSLLTSVAVNDHAPYKEVVSQGFVNDGEGRKMSKSLGNTVSPNDVCDQRGADILRLWVASVDSRYDVRISDDILGQVAESYRKIRNTLRFTLGNLFDFDAKKNYVAYEELDSIDQYILVLLNELVDHVIDYYNHYDFNSIYQEIINFLTQVMSSFYLDYSKDVTYILLADDPKRRNMQTVMYEVLKKMTILLTPIIPHTTEEIWSYMGEAEDYVQLADFPQVEDYSNAEALKEKWEKFFNFRGDVNHSLESARNEKVIGKSLEAKVIVYAKEDSRQFLESIGEELKTYLIVSQLEIKDYQEADDQAADYEDYAIAIVPAEGKVCDRCRGVYPSVGSVEGAENLCQRCADIVLKHFPEALVKEED